MCTEAGKTAEGVQGQKRLILEHAAEMYDELRSMSGVRVVMDAGYAVEEGGEVAVCKVRAVAAGGVCAYVRVSTCCRDNKPS